METSKITIEKEALAVVEKRRDEFDCALSRLDESRYGNENDAEAMRTAIDVAICRWGDLQLAEHDYSQLLNDL